MRITLEWLKEYIDLDADAESFCKKMLHSGFRAEPVRDFGKDIKNVVIGRVLSVSRHEDSEHLFIIQVDVGAEQPLQIVTGAPNVTADAFVPVALHRSELPGGVKIKKGKLRGVASEGMLCAAAEFGFEESLVPEFHRDGIWILDGTYTVGADFVEALGLEDTVVDLEILADRPDCLSLAGIAMEAAAALDIK
ncbi:MAG: hypothetical protein LBT26_03270 [Clostridiales Family XIII bacterium]|jgi:phenylalanyl-tRNA synthetase beta chain|nr:hypothetical protein [Clostridiales Family XIII bacterium]